MSSTGEISIAIEHAYDETPYPELCYAYTHPGRLAAIGRLLGLEPVAVDGCRVLEIGCAGGGNLVPMAFGLPGSTFTGLDLSTRQIESAQRFAGSLGLRNVDFRAMDLMDVTAELGTFDYIVAHGMYSWVPDEVKDQLLEICRRNLSPMGIAYVSYNTLPGWHPLLMIREMMLFHTRDIVDPRARAHEGRALIGRLRSMVPDADSSVFASFLDAYVETRLGRFAGHDAWEESAFLHDELAAVNDPVHVHQFVEHAGRHGLQYLADATFPQSATHDLSSDAVRQLEEMAPDVVEFEQYLDYVQQQSFRRTLLCHADVPVRRSARAGLDELHVTSRAQLVGDAGDDGGGTGLGEFRTSDGSTYPAQRPVTTAALQRLGERSPRAERFSALLAQACERAGVEPDADAAALLAADLLEAASQSNQLVELLAADPVLAPVPSVRPVASPVVRHQARHSRFVANLRHEQVTLTGLGRALVAFLDGHHSRDDLLGELLAMVADGRLSGPPQRDTTPDQIRRQMAADIDHTLRWLGRAAVLTS